MTCFLSMINQMGLCFFTYHYGVLIEKLHKKTGPVSNRPCFLWRNSADIQLRFLRGGGGVANSTSSPRKKASILPAALWALAMAVITKSGP